VSGGSYDAVLGSEITAAFGDSKSKVEVKSRATVRLHAVMFGSVTPKRCSRKRISDVWSNTSEFTNPPLLHGEITIIGTRTPNPYGPGTKSGTGYDGLPANNSFVVPTVEVPSARDRGGVGGTI